MSQTPNPFTMVYDTLWEMVDTHPSLRVLMKEGNRIKFNTPSREPLKDAVAVADLPELILTSDGLSAALYNTTSTSKVVRSYSWLLSTGDFRVNELLYQVEWYIFCAMLSWKEKLCALKWHDESFVKRADVTSVTNGQSNPELNRGIKGWSAIWKCEVEMHFRTSFLKGELEL